MHVIGGFPSQYLLKLMSNMFYRIIAYCIIHCLIGWRSKGVQFSLSVVPPRVPHNHKSYPEQWLTSTIYVLNRVGNMHTATACSRWWANTPSSCNKNSRHIHKERQNPQHKLREVVMGSQEELLITGERLLWLCLLASAPWIFEAIVPTQLH